MPTNEHQNNWEAAVKALGAIKVMAANGDVSIDVLIAQHHHVDELRATLRASAKEPYFEEMQKS